MMTRDAFMIVDAAEQLLDGRDAHTSLDAFLDQTLRVCEHGVTLTDLGRLILHERLRMARHPAGYC